MKFKKVSNSIIFNGLFLILILMSLRPVAQNATIREERMELE
jgi:hypothetical protein